MFNLAWSFFKRDATIEMSYKISFCFQLIGNFVLLIIFYYIGKLTVGNNIPALAKYGGNYLAFLLIGVALTECVGVSLTTFAKQIREGQLTGSLELTLLSPISLSWILIYSALWPYFISSIRFLIYLILGMVFYKVGFSEANISAALLIFLLVVLSFAGLGMCWASVVLIIKRGEGILALMGYGFIIVSGVLFPATLLPQWTQNIAAWIPLTHGLEGMRLALLQGHTISQQIGLVSLLFYFSVILLGAGLVSFYHAVLMAKHSGSLSQY